MKRYAAILSVALAAAGCESTGMNSPFEKKPAAAAKTPDQANYFEIKKDGHTYILGSNASREAFLAGTTPTVKETKFDNGKTAMVENTDYNEYNRLVAEYKKAKGL
jgi:hypothetical protein